MIVSVRSHPDCLKHIPTAGHPEVPERVGAVVDALKESGGDGWEVDGDAPYPGTSEVLGVLKWVHETAYLERVREAAKAAPGFVDSPDCPVSCGTFEAAVAAAGLAQQAALDLVNQRLTRGFVVARPPSHHAGADEAKGFCFFNAVALAAEVVVGAWNHPVLVVDFDVHHGNGTQLRFYERADVGYVSVHQYPLFPGTGAGDEVGAGKGRGTTRNVPLAAGADDAIYCTALEDALEEIGSRMRPAAVIVSAGFDAHQQDPVGGMRLTADGFARMTRAIVQAAECWADGRVLSVLEGGFHLEAMAESARAHVAALAAGMAPPN